MDSNDQFKYDFLKLSQSHDYLKQFIDSSTGCFHFSTEGQAALTKAILKDQFNIDIQLLPGHLCPPIPSKIIYLRIINRVLQESRCLSESERVRGLDIGTGAYAIYAILGFKLYNWNMVGVDIDQESINNCERLLELNDINKQDVQVFLNDGLLKIDDNTKFTFTMCNPPFFDSDLEMLENKSFKEDLGHDSVVGTSNELIVEGGEVSFITKLIHESSSNYQDSIIWFSSLIGKKSSIEPILSKLKSINCLNYFIKDYQLGKTKRWIIFWSFQYYRPEIHSSYKSIQSTIIEFPINLSKLHPILLNYQFERIELKEEEEIEIVTNGDVWSRSFKRSGKKPNPKERYVFIIRTNQIHWAFGKSAKVYQSFHTMIRKAMAP